MLRAGITRSEDETSSAGVTRLLLPRLREALAERAAAAGPLREALHALSAPAARAPPEHGGRRESDDRGGRQQDLLYRDEQVESVGDDAEREEDERLDLEHRHQEHERERRRTERAVHAVRERDVEERTHCAAHHRRWIPAEQAPRTGDFVYR